MANSKHVIFIACPVGSRSSGTERRLGNQASESRLLGQWYAERRCRLQINRLVARKHVWRGTTLDGFLFLQWAMLEEFGLQLDEVESGRS